MPNWGLDSPGNQPTGETFVSSKKSRTKCINHYRRNAVALWGRQLEPVCLICLIEIVKQCKKPKS